MSRPELAVAQSEWHEGAINEPAAADCGADLAALDGVTIHGSTIEVGRLVAAVAAALRAETPESSGGMAGGQPVDRSTVVATVAEAAGAAVMDEWGGANARGVERFAAYYDPAAVAAGVSDHITGGVYETDAALRQAGRVGVAYALGQLNAWNTAAQVAASEHGEADVVAARETAGRGR